MGDGMQVEDRSDRVCLVGAGYAGNGLARALKEAGIAYDQLEATQRIGGNWSHGVYDSTHLISSKASTQYVEHPMPDDYPTFPSGAQMLAYLESYVDRFGLREHLELGVEVTGVWPVDADGTAGWYVELADGRVRRYQAVALANGHYWDPRVPEYPGAFTGHQLHSKDYKRPADFGPGPRVLVVGAGNSASDLAVEASATFGSADISMRRGYWFLPKTIFGIPSSELDRVWAPLALQRLVMHPLLRLSWGDYRWYGLQRPDHRLFSKDVTVSSTLLYALRHGRVHPRPEIERLDGDVVYFRDGTSEKYDCIVWATGFHTRFPMLDDDVLAWEDGQPLLVQHALVPRYANLYVWGNVAPRSGAGRIISHGADFLAEAIRAQEEFDEPISDLVARWLPARSSMLASSADLVGRIRVARLLLRTLRTTRSLRGRRMTLPPPTPSGRAVVTGASSGIGAALAENLAARGHGLVLVARRADRLEELAGRLRAAYDVPVDVRPTDLADAAERDRLVAALREVPIDVLCLNAGFATYGALTELDADREREQVNVNVVAVHDLLVALLPQMVEAHRGAVLVTGSTAGNQPGPHNATYAATKAFANTLAESLHAELRGTGVTCTLLAPGPVRTEFADVSHLGALADRLPSFAWVSAEQAAEAAVTGVKRGRRRVVPGATAKLQDLGGQHAPRRILSPILARVYGAMR